MRTDSRSTLRPFANPRFRALWLATTASHVGSYMTDVGQGWLMTSLAPSPLVVSLLLTAESLPFFALGLPAGALADILDRRRLLIVTQLAMAVVVGMLAAATFTGVVTPWMLLALAFALGTATALNDPAWHAIVPEVLPPEELAAGVTLAGAGVNVARSLGPALGGLVVAAAGPGVVFVLDALSFLAVVAVLLAWRRERPVTHLPPERVLGAIRAGFRFARNSDALRRVLLAVFAFMACGSGVMALMPVLGRETGRGPVGYGLLLGSLGVGAVGGAMFLPWVRSRVAAERVVAAAALAFAAVAAGASTLRALGTLCPLMLVGGVAWISALSTLTVAAQQASPSWVRARALAVYLMVFQAAIAGGSVLWGAVASRAGLRAAYFGIAAGLVAAAVIAARQKLESSASVDHTPAHHWPEPLVAGAPPLEAGPVLIQVEYRIDPPCADAFRVAMAALARERRRHGAERWWLLQDSSDPTVFVELWLEATWAEHLRYHERVSVAHRETERRAQELIRAGSTITTRHFIASADRPMTSGFVRAVEERTRC